MKIGLIHGYTGDFKILSKLYPQAKKLPYPKRYKYMSYEEILKSFKKYDNKFDIIVGHSLGALVASDLAAKKKVLINYPSAIKKPWINLVKIIKYLHFPKNLKLNFVPGKGLEIIMQGCKDRDLSNCLIINSLHDPFFESPINSIKIDTRRHNILKKDKIKEIKSLIK